MKKLFSLLFLASFVLTAFTQVPVITSKVKTLGTLSANGLTIAINPVLADTLKGTDTLFYKVPTFHTNTAYPYLSLIEKKAGTNDTTALLTFWQSVDGTHNWQQILNTASPTAWSTTLAKATGTDIDFWRSIAWFQSTYLGIRLISTGTSTTGKYKNIYYGSIRLNSGK
jgi:hypothetical protein